MSGKKRRPVGEVLINGHRGASDWLYDHGYILSVGALMNMASKGSGPPHEKMGRRVVYIESELAKWADDRWVIE